MNGAGVQVEALGVAGAPAPRRLTTTYRLSGGIVLDTGAATHGLAVAERRRITTVLLSHAHLDHTLGLPFLLAETRPVVHGPAHALEAVRGSLLDGRIWPDLSDRAEWRPLAEGDTLALGPWQVEAGPARHTVPCLSFWFRAGPAPEDAKESRRRPESERGRARQAAPATPIEEKMRRGGAAKPGAAARSRPGLPPGHSVLILGDTRREDGVLEWAAGCRPTDCVVEVSFPDRMQELARRFGHQTPCDLPAWREALGPACRIHVAHTKPAHEDAVRAECGALGDPDLRILNDGDVLLP